MAPGRFCAADGWALAAMATERAVNPAAAIAGPTRR
jgi:hypothetical protein